MYLAIILVLLALYPKLGNAMSYITVLPIYPSEYLLVNNVTEYLRSFKKYAYNLPQRPTTEGQFPLYDYLTVKSYGTFLNISYSEIFLKLSTRTSMLYLLTEHCKA